MPREPVAIRIVTSPDAACAGPSWSDTVRMVRGSLLRRFGDAVAIEHVTAFSPRFFALADLTSEIQGDMQLPIVFVNGVVLSRGGKLSEPRIAQAVRAAGASEDQRRDG